MRVGWHARTCAHNLGFPDGFDTEVSEEKATSFGCGVCSVRLPVLQISKYRTARNYSKLHFWIVYICVVVSLS